MSFSLTTIKADLDTAVTDAVNIGDLVDKVADIVAPFAGDIPGVGPDVTLVVDAINEGLVALKKVQSLLAAA
jgi:hypothetical protein